jgi:hypothetical protein
MWQYKVLAIPKPELNAASVEDRLNELGALGWELCTFHFLVTVESNGYGVGQFVFKRVKPAA